MDEREIRLRLVEAAARNPVPHPGGFAAGVLDAARSWEQYVLDVTGKNPVPGKGTLGLPRK